MKATLKKTGSQFLLTLTPETQEDIAEAKALASSRSTYIFHRGYGYMSADIQFLIQEPSTGRD